MDNNALIILPVSIGQLKNLEYLYLYNTYLRNLPFTIETLPNLILLDITNNSFTFYPPKIGTLKKIRQGIYTVPDIITFQFLPPNFFNYSIDFYDWVIEKIRW